MIGLHYWDLTNARILRTLEGQGFSFPRLTEGTTLYLGGRLCEEIEGRMVAKQATVTAVRVTISPLDEQPTTGQVKLLVGNDAPAAGTNLTIGLSLDATANAIETALNDLTIVGTTYGAATVEVRDQSWFITFAEEEAAVPLKIRGNTLAPISIGRIHAWEVNDEWKHRVRFQRVPVAFTDSMIPLVPPPPEITRVQGGSTVDDVAINEIQKLTIPSLSRAASSSNAAISFPLCSASPAAWPTSRPPSPPWLTSTASSSWPMQERRASRTSSSRAAWRARPRT